MFLGSQISSAYSWLLERSLVHERDTPFGRLNRYDWGGSTQVRFDEHWNGYDRNRRVEFCLDTGPLSFFVFTGIFLRRANIRKSG